MTNTKLQIGTIVRHKRKFLNSICWHTNVPKNGIIVDIGCRGRIASVWWCDKDELSGILLSNIEVAPADKSITDDMRKLRLEQGKKLPDFV